MLIVIAAWVAALLVFSSFFMKTMIPLRVVAITSNAGFVTYALLGLKYGIFGRVYPILVLHSLLLPLNVLRLRQIKGLINAVNAALACPSQPSCTNGSWIYWPRGLGSCRTRCGAAI